MSVILGDADRYRAPTKCCGADCQCDVVACPTATSATSRNLFPNQFNK